MARLKYLMIIFITLIIFFSCDPMDDNDFFGDPPTPESCFCDPEGVETYLKWLWSEYPDVTNLRTIGDSETGRNIYVLEISDYAGSYQNTVENEPAVLVNGGIHGHEQIGVGVPMKLAEYLLQVYYDEYDGEITQAEIEQAVYIIENIKLHIMPAVNPDGLQASSRYNDNNVDLNRNFDWNRDEYDSNNGGFAFDQSESAAIRDDFADYSYCLSLNFHTSTDWQDFSGGGVGIYAPWDAIKTSETGFEDQYLQNYNSFIKPLGEEYAAKVVDEGIYPFDEYFHYAEGADWYVFGGSMTDWALGNYGTVSYSIELYGDQNFTTDDYFLLDQTWDANRQAIIDMVLSSEQGTGGRVVDSYGSPVQGAQITLDTGGGRAPAITPYPDLKALTDRDGKFRLLTGIGDYSISIEKDGYITESQSITISTDNSSTLNSRGLTDNDFYREYVLTSQ